MVSATKKQPDAARKGYLLEGDGDGNDGVRLRERQARNLPSVHNIAFDAIRTIRLLFRSEDPPAPTIVMNAVVCSANEFSGVEDDTILQAAATVAEEFSCAQADWETLLRERRDTLARLTNGRQAIHNQTVFYGRGVSMAEADVRLADKPAGISHAASASRIAIPDIEPIDIATCRDDIVAECALRVHNSKIASMTVSICVNAYFRRTNSVVSDAERDEVVTSVMRDLLLQNIAIVGDRHDFILRDGAVIKLDKRGAGLTGADLLQSIDFDDDTDDDFDDSPPETEWADDADADFMTTDAYEYPEIDFAALGIKPEKATAAKPGSEEKVIMLTARYAAGLPLWHDEDCVDHSPDDLE